MRLLPWIATLAACGGSPSAEEPQPLQLERFSPPQFTSHDIFVGARGDLVVLAHRLSRDGGATWQPVDARLGTLERVAIDGNVLATYANGLVRWNVETGELATVTTPAFASARTWRTQAGKFIAFDAVKNAIAFETASGFRQSTLPQPSPTEIDPYISDVASNGSVALAVSAWGVFRSSDGGATWQRAHQLAGAGRVLVAVPDGRFVLLGGSKTYRFTATGELAGEATGIAVEQNEVAVCGDGAVIARDSITRDAGATWQPLLPGGDVRLNVVRVSCGDGYWLLGYSDAWGYRLLRYDPATSTGLLAGNWELAGDPAWANGGPPIVRAPDGTFLAAGLAWGEGDATWALREIPLQTWAAGDALYGIADATFYASRDGGRAWTATMPTGLDAELEIEAFADDGGTLLASHFSGETSGGLDRWRSRVWRSTDGGATWTIAYDAEATRPEGGGELTGEVHRFIGVADDGAWIATDAVSLDQGATWQASDVDGDRSLAFLTPLGHLVTTLPAGSPVDDVWRVYEAGGRGALRATWAIEAEGTPVPASQLRSVAFDAEGYAYVARGTPYVQLWRTAQPLR